MSSFDITRIAGSQPLRQTGAHVPPQDTRDTRDTMAQLGPKTSGGAPPQSGVEVRTSALPNANAGEPPVDTDRVAEIRDALKQGKYPINPAEIADAMIAAKLRLAVSE